MAIQVTGGGPLDVAGHVTLDANGNGDLELGPVPPRAQWLLSRMTVHVTGPTAPMPTCTVYQGSPHPSRLLDATWTGAQDVSDFGAPYPLEDGDRLTFRWEGGTPGETATARLIGRQLLV